MASHTDGCVIVCQLRTNERSASRGISPPAVHQPVATAAKLMIFGGDGHRTYLGCLNCSEYAADSVHNQYGTHGSPYNSESILNHYSQFGSPYSTESACNTYASDPPVIVDGNGRYYGRLTLNQYHPLNPCIASWVREDRTWAG
jgi:hypothetical protein